MSHTENLIESVRGDKAAMERELQAAWYRLQNAEDGASGDDAAFILACADELGAPYAQLLASHMALEGIGMEADSGAARDWLEKACAADFPLALVQLGRFLTIEGSGRDDEAKARECFGRALEIDAPEARAALGESLVLGGLGSDHVEDGARLLRAAAEDDPECAMLLARFIEEGKIQPAEGENTFLLIARRARGDARSRQYPSRLLPGEAGGYAPARPHAGSLPRGGRTLAFHGRGRRRRKSRAHPEGR